MGEKRIAIILGCSSVFMSGELDRLQCNPEKKNQNSEYSILLQSIRTKIHPLYTLGARGVFFS